MKITGYLSAQVEAGTFSQGYSYETASSGSILTMGNGQPMGGINTTTPTVLPAAPPHVATAGVGAGYGQLFYTPTSTAARNELGYTTRAELEFITKTNTAYGVLTADIDTQFNYGSGFDNTGPNAFGGGQTFINHGFLNWAGITAGKANSFFSFFGGGEGWANVFSPDRQGYNQPLLLAYTATFGGGFSATISLEDPVLIGGSAGGTLAGTDEYFAGNSSVNGQRAPDIVASLDLAQGWGGAHLAGVAHYVDQTSLLDGTTINTWGWAIDGGVKFNLPTLGAGDNVQLQAEYTQNAIWYSGVSDAMWGENGAVNGNGIAMPVTDAFSNGDGTWATPDAFSITALGEFHLGPTFSIDPEISYLNITWSGISTGLISANQNSWLGGAVFHWDPVAHLDFNLELLYQNTHQSAPGAYSAAANGGLAWKANTDGLEGRLIIARDF